MSLKPPLLAFVLAVCAAFAAVTPAPAATPLAVLSATAPVPDNTPRGPKIYKLPYPAGFTFTMCQGNNQGSHTGNGKYAWDFCMPIGTPVTASRGGTVKWVRQDFMEHGHGTSAIYMHLMHNGVRVKPGQRVETGQLLAYSGNTGWSGGPHTHFMVMQSSSYDWYAPSSPVAFAGVPGNGVPTTGMRLPSDNAPIDPALILPPCDLGTDAGLKGFTPFWVESFRPSAVWSGPDAAAVQFGLVGSWEFFQVVAPQSGSRLKVRVASTGGVAYVPAADVGPSGPPPPDGSCRPGGSAD